MKKTKMLKKNYEFKSVLCKGNYYSGKTIEVFIKKDKEESYNKLGVAIGVKIAKAVRRNFIKRRIKEVYIKLEPQIETGYSFVFLWKKKVSVDEANFHQIGQDMKKILKKAKLLKIEENQ